MFTTPGGKPAALMSSQRRMAVRGVTSEGLRTIALPVARAGASLHAKVKTRKISGQNRGNENLSTYGGSSTEQFVPTVETLKQPTGEMTKLLTTTPIGSCLVYTSESSDP
jgi:hypothetical protein